MLARILQVLLAVAAVFAIALGVVLHDRGVPALWAITLGVASVFGLHAAVLAIESWLAALVAGPAPPRFRLRGLSRLRPWAGELAASIRTFWVAQPLFGARPLDTARPGHRVAVVLVHGYFCNRALWRPFARWLAARGHPVGSVNLEPVFGSIDEYVPTIATEIERMLAIQGVATVALVGHSMGGLAIRAYLRAHGWRRVCTVVTIGTPHVGTWVARCSPARNARQMRLGSDWLGSLERAEPPPPRDRFVVILSHHDNIVTPPSWQSIVGARTVELGALGHVALAYAPEVWRVVAEALDAVGPSDGAEAPTADLPTLPAG